MRVFFLSQDDGQGVVFHQFPAWELFKAGLEQTTICLPDNFRYEYYNPFMFALARELQSPDRDLTLGVYCCFNVEGRTMSIEAHHDSHDVPTS